MTSSAKADQPPRWRRVLARRRTRWFLAALVLVIAVRIALPYVVRRVAIDQADKALTGRIELDDVDLAVLTGGITLHGLRVFANEAPPGAQSAAPLEAGEGSPGSAPVFSAQRLSVDLGWLALLHKTVEVQGVELEGFVVSLDRARNGTLVLPAPAPSSAAPAPENNEPSGWGVLIERVALRDGKAGFRDFAVGEPPQHLDVKIPTVDAANLALRITASGLEPGKLGLDAAVQDGTLHLDATIENLAAGPAIETHLVLTSLPIGDARVYIPRVGWSELAGRLDTDLVHRFESRGAHTLRGRIALRDLAVHVKDLAEPAISWQALSVELAGVDLVKQHADVSTVALEGARVVTMPGGPEPLPLLRGVLTAAEEHGVATPANAPPPARALPPSSTPAPTTATTPNTADSSPELSAHSADSSPHVEATPKGAPPSAPAVVAQASPAAPWTWKVATVAVKNAAIKAIGGDGSLDVAVDADLATLASAPDTHSRLSLTLAPSSGGSLTLAGDVTLQPIGFGGTLRADALVLPALTSPIATAQTRLLKRGIASMNLEIAAGAATNAPANGARVAGTIGLTDLDIAGEDPKAFGLRWKELALAIREIVAPGVLAAPAANASPITVALSSATLVRPELVVTRTTDGIALPEAIGGSPPSRVAPGARANATSPTKATPTPLPAAPLSPRSATSPAKPGQDVQVRIDRLAIQKMAVTVTDQAVKPFYRSSLDPIDLGAVDVRWPGPFAHDVKLTAKSADGATFTLTGNVAPTDSQLVAKLDRLPLSPFNPYAAGSGYGVAGGTAQLESTIKIRRGSYDTRSKLVLNKLAVSGGAGESLFASQFGMPLSLALSLLTDLEGNIVIDLPITADEKGLSIGFGTIIGNALAQAILHAVTSPLKLIGLVTSIGDKPASVVPQPIVFHPGRAELGAGEDQKLEQLRTLLAAAPGLQVHLRGEASDEDRRWLREQALRAKLADETGVVGTLRHIGERGARAAALEVLTARANGTAAEIPEEHKPWFEEQVARQEVPDATLVELAGARAKQVQSELARKEGIAADRVILDATTPDDVKSRPVVAIGLGAEPARAPAQPPETTGNQ